MLWLMQKGRGAQGEDKMKKGNVLQLSDMSCGVKL